MKYLAFTFALLMAFGAMSAYADPMDDVDAAIFETTSNARGEVKNIKAKFRKCANDTQCTTVLSVCRWRPVSKSNEQYVTNVSSQVQPECKWPQPPQVGPVARCLKNLCEILPDNKYY